MQVSYENRAVHFFFDESGDFAFPNDRFDAYTQAAVICPDSRLADLDSFVSERCERGSSTSCTR
jgi:hypothetical protein